MRLFDKIVFFFEEITSSDIDTIAIDLPSTQYRVYQCFNCPGDKEYVCVSCKSGQCDKCQSEHVYNLKTIDHNVVSYREIYNNSQEKEICVKHPNVVYKNFCELCEVPICNKCTGHETHRKLDIKTAFESKRQNYKGTIHTIRSSTLFNTLVLLTEIKTDVNTCQKQFSIYQSELLTRTRYLKYLIDFFLCDFDFQHRCVKQKLEMNRYINSLQLNEHMYEQSGMRPKQFLQKKEDIFQVQKILNIIFHTSQLSMTDSLNKKAVVGALSQIKIKENCKRCVGDDRLLTLMYRPQIHNYFSVNNAKVCHHISRVSSDRVWVSDSLNRVLTDNTGKSLHKLEVPFAGVQRGLNTVNRDSEMIFIDTRNEKYHDDIVIKKLSKEMKGTTIFIDSKLLTGSPRCVFCSPSSGDLLIGVYQKVIRYDQTGKLTQIIQNDTNGIALFDEPRYLTENKNGDIVVSDSSSVVVTENGGKYRFSYKGYPSGSVLMPRGICTDALLHILLCDERTKSVQILDKDGQFLSYLLSRPSGIFEPYSLSYDYNTHRLWVGSFIVNKLCVYNYLMRKDDQIGMLENDFKKLKICIECFLSEVL